MCLILLYDVEKIGDRTQLTKLTVLPLIKWFANRSMILFVKRTERNDDLGFSIPSDMEEKWEEPDSDLGIFRPLICFHQTEHDFCSRALVVRSVGPNERPSSASFFAWDFIQSIRHNNDIPTSLERATMNLPPNATTTTTTTTTTKVPPLPSPIDHGTWWDEAKRLLSLAIPASIIKMMKGPMLLFPLVGVWYHRRGL